MKREALATTVVIAVEVLGLTPALDHRSPAAGHHVGDVLDIRVDMVGPARREEHPLNAPDDAERRNAAPTSSP